MAPKRLISLSAIPPSFGIETEPRCLDALKARLDGPGLVTDCWPTRSASDGQQTIQVFHDHSTWYEEVKSRVTKRGWNPHRFRVACLDPVVAARTATWLRKSQLQKRSSNWVVGEYVRLADPVFDATGGLIQEADQDCRITLIRSIQYGDSRGVLHWTTPAKAEPRQLDISIAPIDLFAIRLTPLNGEKSIAVLTEKPGANAWRGACRDFRQTLAGARHLPDIYEQGLVWSGELQRQVVRLRPAAAVPAVVAQSVTSEAIAMHADMLRPTGAEQCDLVRAVVAAASNELLVYQERMREMFDRL